MRDGHRVLDADAHVVEPAIWGDALPPGAWPLDIPATTPSVMCGDTAVIADQLYGRNLGDAAVDPLYDAVAEEGIVLAVHEGLGVLGPTIGDRFDTFSLRHACSHPMEQMASMASLFLEGALERHPNMRVAFLESGTGWLPYWLARLDSHREWMAGTEGA